MYKEKPLMMALQVQKKTTPIMAHKEKPLMRALKINKSITAHKALKTRNMKTKPSMTPRKYTRK
jgi:hypothetical protein